MAKLRTYVHVGGKVYGPGDDVPAEVAKKITNPDVWEAAEPKADKLARRTTTTKG